MATKRLVVLLLLLVPVSMVVVAQPAESPEAAGINPSGCTNAPPHHTSTNPDPVGIWVGVLYAGLEHLDQLVYFAFQVLNLLL